MANTIQREVSEYETKFYNRGDAGTLYTKENSMLEALSFQGELLIGSVTENRTPITGMRILCPNR